MNNTKPALKHWGTIEGQDIYLYHLQNANGIGVDITNFGASVTAITTPDKEGNFTDIAFGYDNLQGYINDNHYIGAIVGRYANRIAGGLVELDGKFHQLTVKPGGYHHHGGAIGFNKKVWKPTFIMNNGSPSVKMEYLSPDGEEGFPGNLLVTVTYTLNDQDQLIVDLSAKTDKTTLLNLTQHTYFNLAGHASGNILEHELMMPLNSYLPVTKSQVPHGEIAPVNGTPFDFKTPKAIGKDIDAGDEQLILSDGYDHSWVIKGENSDELTLAAQVTEAGSGRVLTVYTTEPAVHLYPGNALDGAVGKDGAIYTRRSGFCLETQQYPDSPNQPHFPNTVLREGEIFKSKTIFEFGISK
ncbi:aldose epimerase family protein [Mucilaginibacter sp. OK098]|uniref:aldose epimerase family protein n=1 Tax=Mucilaginibacter sp. OK098 TaxID=1855297 RepID=UPI00091F3FDD|nr:aldose epimerase family protein [Mucilaginibacter sp. OK098]SHM59254.1 aldose 1-epimerase [Mucilaginibacter sp. OK098]